MRSKLKLSYADIRTLPSRTRVATLECAGNGRVFANTLPLAETRCDEPEIAAECFYGFQGCTDYSAGNLRLAGILCRHEDARRSLLMQNRSNALSENKPEFRRPTCEAKSLLDIAARSLRPNRVRGFREAQMRVTIGKD